MDFMIFCVLVGLSIICFYLAKKIEESNQKAIEKRMEPINKMNNEYEEKVKVWCNNNNVLFKENITKTKEIRVNKRLGYIWFSNKDIVFCPVASICGTEMDIAGNIIFMEYDKIKYFTKDGTVSYTNEVINDDKKIAVSGRVVGEFVRSEIDAPKMKNITVKHDEVHTYIYLEKDNEVKAVEIKGNEFYQNILQLMPEKEYEYILHDMQKSSENTTDYSNIKTHLKELKSMFEEGLITEAEYNNKKQELLSKM